MKNKIIYLLFGVTLIFSSCTKDFEELNKYPKSPEKVQAKYILPTAMGSIAFHYSDYSVNDNVMPVTSQHFAQTAYVDESRGIFRDALRDSYGGNYYTALSDLNNAKSIIEEELLADKAANDADAQGKYNFKKLIITTLEVFSFQCITDAYGPAMYKEAFNLENLTPKYNSQQEIYEDLLTKLASAVDSSSNLIDDLGDQDIIYGGNTSAWAKFANSLMLRMAMRISDINPTLSVQYVNKAVNENGGVFTSNADNALYQYLSSSPNQHPIYNAFKTRVEIASSNTMIDIMKASNDPRLWEYIFWSPGWDYGSSSYSLWEGQEYGSSSPNEYWESCYANKWLMGRWDAGKADFPAIFIDYAEVKFFLAEAVVRGGGYLITGTAKEHYDDAIEASIQFYASDATGWWPSGDAAVTTMVADFLVETEVDLDLALTTEDKLARIGTQKWVALFYQAPEAWAEARRLDAPTFNVPEGQVAADLPVRLKFSPREYIINQANVEAATSMLKGGSDEYTTKLWWDVN